MLTPGYFCEIVQSESPFRTTWILVSPVLEDAVEVVSFELLDALVFAVVTGFLGYIVNR